MSRPRKPKNRILPPNLYRQKKGNSTYFIYRDPVSSKTKSLGSDQATAARAARVLNNQRLLTPTVERLVSRVNAPAETFARWLTTFETDVLTARRSRKGKPLSPKTLREYKAQLSLTRSSALGPKDVAQITRRDVAVFLEPFPPTYRNRIRGLLHNAFAHAVAEGRRDDNPVEGTLKATEVVARRRLSFTDYQRIYEAAPDWVQRAMQLALLTLQRRADLVRMRHDDVRDGFLYVIQQKTGARLRIALNDGLRAAIGARGPTPEILWRLDRRGEPRPLTPDSLTRAIATIRSDVLQGENPPTFHEIRALGARLLRDAGKDPQPLLGHIDPRTTQWYLDRHEVRWTEVEL